MPICPRCDVAYLAGESHSCPTKARSAWPPLGGGIKWLSYGWSVVSGLITLTIAFAVINHFYEPFERVVVDLLVLIYVAVRGGAVSLAFIAIEQAKLDRNRFLMLMKATGDRQFESEDNQETLDDDNEKIGRANVKVIIQSVFLSLIWLVAFLNLLGAL